MKAIVNRRYGGPEGLELAEVDRPEVALDGVLVRVRAAAVNPYDVHAMRGRPYVARAIFGLRRPKQPLVGLDFAGVVDAVGADAAGFSIGDEVFGARAGALAQYVCVTDAVAPKPARLSFEQAAAVPTAAVTALQALRDHGNVRAGQRVLVNGAAGGVGTFAVQIAKALGAHVSGVCSTRNVDLVASLGADEVVDYTQDDFARRPARYDVIVNAVERCAVRRLRGVLSEEGTLVLVAAPLVSTLVVPLVTRRSSRRVVAFVAKPSRADLSMLGDLIEAGTVRPVVETTYPLARAADAIRHVETRHARGKVVVTVGGS